MEIANASLLDEATAAAEAMHLCQNVKPERNGFFVSELCHPQTIEVIRTRRNRSASKSSSAIIRRFKRTKKFLAQSCSIRQLTVRFTITKFLENKFTTQVRYLLSQQICAHVIKTTGRIRSGCRRGKCATVWSSARIRRPARRIFCDARYVETTNARTFDWRFQRFKRTPCPAAFVANARATYPSRKSDEQHLHGASVAREHGVDVCGLSWAGRFEKNCATNLFAYENSGGVWK